MIKTIAFAILSCFAANAHAQAVQDWKTFYRSTPEKQLSMVHTKLEVSFDYEKKRMAGKAWLTMTPHFYATDSAILDAKGMLINEVSVVQGTTKTPLSYDYRDSMVLRIKLNKTNAKNEQVVLYIDYVARPDELKTRGSAAITSAKGLYFINPDGKDSTKPVQIWTQGETEATSVWCPTVDRPNQKTTQEIAMTVPDQYVTLSNGVLEKQQKNSNGTRTDYWKMDLPHAPYLMFMGVGDFAVIKDKYKSIPVDYYVEKEYASVAQRIYGNTPEMIDFFSKLLGVEYPWPKYAQMVGTDYVSGAMENTTATLHGTYANQTARQLVDGNSWEPVIAHELFHHWFGDLVTAESWSNLTVNESFADYSEYLWTEYKYGRDAADAYNQNAMLGYLNNPNDRAKHLTRFYYRDKEDMFDQVSYQKGGRILHMLRNELGDSAFFKGLKLYLQQQQFKAAEAHQLRLALEEVSGRDLNPFFNQWYFNSGHPEVKISYGRQAGSNIVVIEQTQKERLFEIPLKIAAYGNDGKVTIHKVTLSNKVDTFYFDAGTTPTFYEADADRVVLWDKKETKTADQWIAQFARRGNYASRKEALAGLVSIDSLAEITRTAMLSALKDGYEGIRSQAIRYFIKYPMQLRSEQDWGLIEGLAKNEKDRPTRAETIDLLAKRTPTKYNTLFKASVLDSSYTVAGAALEALIVHDLKTAATLKQQLEKDAEGRLASSLNILDIAAAPVEATDSLIAVYKKLPGLQRVTGAKGMMYLADKQTTLEGFKAVITPVVDIYKRIPAGFGTYKSDMLTGLQEVLVKKEKALAADRKNKVLKEMIDWLKPQLN